LTALGTKELQGSALSGGQTTSSFPHEEQPLSLPFLSKGASKSGFCSPSQRAQIREFHPVNVSQASFPIFVKNAMQKVWLFGSR